MRVESHTVDKKRTRELILDATEKIMREHGYAAVSSRKIANEAGLKSQLVHYHFGTMEDLFLALFQRAESRNFDRLTQAMSSPRPLHELWKISIDRSGMGLIYEFMALANHRPVLREEIARANVRARRMHIAMMTRALKERQGTRGLYPPGVASMVLSGTALQLVSEEAIGVTEAHEQTFDYVANLLNEIEPGNC